MDYFSKNSLKAFLKVSVSQAHTNGWQVLSQVYKVSWVKQFLSCLM